MHGCFITQNPYSPKLRVAIEGVTDFHGSLRPAHTSWEVQGLCGGEGGTETRLCPRERQGSEFGCPYGGGQCTDPQTVMSPVPSGPGLLKPGV